MKKTVLLLLFLGQTLIAFAQAPDPKLQKLKANLAAAKHDTSRMMAYVDMSEFFESINKLDSALIYDLKAEELANKYPKYPKTPNVWNCLGRVYAKLYQDSNKPTAQQLYYDQGIKAYNKCIEQAKQLGDEEFLIRGWFNINLLYGKLPNQHQFFKSSLELINHIRQKARWNELDTSIVALTYKRLCFRLDHKMDAKRLNDYMAHFRNLISQESEDYKYYCLFIFGQHTDTWKKIDEENLLKEYKEYKQILKSNHRLDELDLGLANYYFNIQEYKKSFQMMSDFHPTNYGDIQGLDKAREEAYFGIKYMLMGQNAYMLNRNQEAIQYLNKAIHYFNPIENNIGMENEKYTALLYLGKAYKKAGKYKEALACNEQADIRYKQMHDVGIQALMAENDVHLEEIKHEKKLQEARTQTLLKEQEIEIQKKQKYVVSGLLALTLLVALWAFYNFQKKNELSKRLETKNQLISQQAEELAESNQLKDKIFALLSHDLRSPINRLIVALGSSIENQRMALMQELYNVQGVLNNVLYWSSMQVKGIKPHLADVHLKLTIDSVLKEFEHLFQEKQLTPINAIGSEVMLVTDETYLKIILRNLINNAIKFTEPQGFVHINYQKHVHKAMLIVKDTGIGMNAEKIATLFHYPVATAGTNKEMGSGLGLSLCYEMVKQLKGKLQVYSQEGHGTKVAIELPI